MRSYLSIRNPKTIILCLVILLLFRYLVGVGFENIYINELFGLFIFLIPIYLFYLILKTKFENRFAKIATVTFFGFFALLSFPFIFLGVVDIYSTAHNGGVDLTQEAIHTVNLGSSVVVVYRSDAGAASSFDISVASKKAILPGMYIEHRLFEVYGADDITLTPVPPDSVRIDAINFSSPEYRAEYMGENTHVTQGETIKVN